MMLLIAGIVLVISGVLGFIIQFSYIKEQNRKAAQNLEESLLQVTGNR